MAQEPTYYHESLLCLVGQLGYPLSQKASIPCRPHNGRELSGLRRSSRDDLANNGTRGTSRTQDGRRVRGWRLGSDILFSIPCHLSPGHTPLQDTQTHASTGCLLRGLLAATTPISRPQLQDTPARVSQPCPYAESLTLPNTVHFRMMDWETVAQISE